MDFTKLQSKLDRSGKKAIYLQIADEIIGYIKKGILKVGETMPSTRRLAAELSVNRNTVVLAFDILASEGWLVSEERKKTRVSDKIRMYQAAEKKEIPVKTTEIYTNDLMFFDDGLPRHHLHTGRRAGKGLSPYFQPQGAMADHESGE